MRGLMTWSLMVAILGLPDLVAAGVSDLAVAPQESVWTTRPLTVEAHFGAGTPYGMAALALDYSPLSWLSINAGGGAGMDGAQVGSTLRLRVPIGPLAPTLGVGVSFGNFKEYGGFLHHVSSVVDGALWMNGDIGLEYRWSTGLRLRAYGGMAQTLWAIDCRVTDGGYENGSCDGTGIEKVYGGLALGYAF